MNELDLITDADLSNVREADRRKFLNDRAYDVW